MKQGSIANISVTYGYCKLPSSQRQGDYHFMSCYSEDGEGHVRRTLDYLVSSKLEWLQQFGSFDAHIKLLQGEILSNLSFEFSFTYSTTLL